MISIDKLVAAGIGADMAPEDLGDLEARAVAAIQTYTTRYFGDRITSTEYVKGNASRNLHLRERAVIADPDYPEITVFERNYPGSQSTEVTAFEIREGETTTILHRTDGSLWTHGYEYVVTYTYGYLLDEGPKDIEQVIIDLLKLRINITGREGIKSETIGGYSYTLGDFESELAQLPGSQSTLDSWRRRVFA